MRLPPVVTAILILLSAVAVARDIQLRNRTIYQDAQVTQVMKHGVVITHRDGAKYVDFDELPEDVAQEAGWTPEKSAARKARMQALEREYWETQRRRKELTERKAEIQRTIETWKPEPDESPEKSKERLEGIVGPQLTAWRRDSFANVRKSLEILKAQNEPTHEWFTLEKSLRRTDYTALYWLGLGALALAGLLASPLGPSRKRPWTRRSKRFVFVTSVLFTLLALAMFFEENSHLGVNGFWFFVPAILLRGFLPSRAENVGNLVGAVARSIGSEGKSASADGKPLAPKSSEHQSDSKDSAKYDY